MGEMKPLTKEEIKKRKVMRPYNREEAKEKKKLRPIKRKGMQTSTEFQPATRVKPEKVMKPYDRTQKKVMRPIKSKKRDDGNMNYVVPKDSPLVPYGKDGKPLNKEEEAYTIDPAKEAAAYKSVMAKALMEPHVLVEKNNEKVDYTLVFNVPSIDPSNADAVPTFDKETTLSYFFEVLLTKPEVAKRLDDFHTHELPKIISRALSASKSKGLVTYNSSVAPSRNRYTSYSRKKSSMEIGFGQIPTQGILKRNVCCDKSNLNHPDWYLGFCRDTYVEITIDPSTNIYKSRGKIIFGRMEGCHAVLPINLPGHWNSHDPITYHIATFIAWDEYESGNWFNDTLASVIQYLRDNQIDTIDLTWAYNIVRKY